MKAITREEKVARFVRAANKKTYQEGSGDLNLILECIVEEFEEFIDAAYDYDSYQDSEARAQLVKEWADLQYVVSQAAWFFGIPADVAFNRVHENNMTKVASDGKVRFREDGKILKPEGYQPANMEGL